MPETSQSAGSPDAGHPYKRYESDALWKVIDSAIEDLVENSDIAETTSRVYIVGYLCKKIRESAPTKDLL